MSQPPQRMNFADFLNRYPVRRVEHGACLEWRGNTNPATTPGPVYGRIWLQDATGRRRQAMAHRVAYEAHKGRPIRANYVLINRACEVGSLCCNPTHWMLVPRRAAPTVLARMGKMQRGLPQRIAVIAGVRAAPNRKLSIDVARALRASDEPATEAAARLGVSAEMVRGIRRGDYWVEPSIFQPMLPSKCRKQPPKSKPSAKPAGPDSSRPLPPPSQATLPQRASTWPKSNPASAPKSPNDPAANCGSTSGPGP